MKIDDIKLLDFKDLGIDEKEMILQWRNNPNIRKWMHNSDIISLENHLNFIDTLSTSRTKKYYLIEQKNEFLGVIYFTDINIKLHTAEFGLYANPNLFAQGKILMKTIMDYGLNILKLKTLYAEVFKNNTKAISLYKKYDFTEYTTKTVDDIQVIYMRYKYYVS